MMRMRKSQKLIEYPVEVNRLPPTYARQPPDGREITFNYGDLHSSSNMLIGIKNHSHPHVQSRELFHMSSSSSGCDDSGVFIDAESPSPELETVSNSINKGGPPNVPSYVKYKSSQGSSSDADTGVTSMSSDSMDELDAGPSPNVRFKKQLTKISNPSSAFDMEAALNGSINGTVVCNNNKSVKERIAMFNQSETNQNNNNDKKINITSTITTTTSINSNNNNNNNNVILSDKNLPSKTSINSSLGLENSKLITSSSSSSSSNLANENNKNFSIYNRNSFLHSRSSSLSDTNLKSSSSSSNASSNYTGHLQPSYRRFSSLLSSNESLTNHFSSLSSSNAMSNSSSNISGSKSFSNGSLLSSILETRKQNATKLKGLVIPDCPSDNKPAVSKTLPTIFTNTSSSTSLIITKSEEIGSLTKKDNHLWCDNSLSNDNQQNPLENHANPSSLHLSEPPWMTGNSNLIPKYSPAFKRRQLELPRSLSILNNISNGSNGSTSSLTSPNSTIASTNVNDTQFQFSLSHSKPVVPLLPETALVSPSFNHVNSKTTNSIQTIEHQLAMNLQSNQFHLPIQRRYSNSDSSNFNSLKMSLQKSTSIDATMPNICQGIPYSMPKDLEYNQYSNKYLHLHKESKSDFKSADKIQKSIYDSITNNNNHKNINQNDLNVFHAKMFSSSHLNDIQPTRMLSSLDYSDDDSVSTSTMSHKTSETSGSSSKADDSASDTTSDSLDRALSPDIARPKALSIQRTVLKEIPNHDQLDMKNNTDSVKNFRALAEKWEQRVGNDITSGKAGPPLPPKPKDISMPRIPPSLMPRTNGAKLNNEPVKGSLFKINDLKETHSNNDINFNCVFA